MQLTLTINESPDLSAEELTSFMAVAEKRRIKPEQLLRETILAVIRPLATNRTPKKKARAA